MTTLWPAVNDLPPSARQAATQAVTDLLADAQETGDLLPWERIASVAAAAAAPHIAAAERERIRLLADNHEARRACLECGNYADGTRAPCCPKSFWFAGLLTEGDTT